MEKLVEMDGLVVKSGHGKWRFDGLSLLLRV